MSGTGHSLRSGVRLTILSPEPARTRRFRVRLPVLEGRCGRGQRPWWRFGLSLGQLGVGLAALVLLWPARLGGTAEFLIVRGNSMEPTFSTGDLVITTSLRRPDVGDVVLYTVPADQPGAGHRVVHRIKARQPDGTYVLQGDNSPSIDPWYPTDANLRGEAVVVLPYVGGMLLGAVIPLGFALLAGITVTRALWPERPEDSAQQQHTRRAGDLRPVDSV